MAKGRKSSDKSEKNAQRAAAARKVAIHCLIGCLFFGAIGVGFAYVRDYVNSEIATPSGPPAIVIKNRPRWMSDFLAQRIAETARVGGDKSPFDREMLVEARAALEKNPWIERVYDVRRAYGNRPGDLLEINCEYRVPVALVKWGDYYSLVDRNGFKLPEQYEAKDVPKIVRIEEGRVDIRIIEGVKKPPPEPGHKWVGDDLAAGLEMIALLSDKPYAAEILKINVSHFYSKGDPQVVLVTKYATEVRWGRAPSAKDAFVEVDAAKKLERLKTLSEKFGRLDAGQTSGLDIRFDTITYPGSAAAGTGMESRR
jgi:hypothetical protein